MTADRPETGPMQFGDDWPGVFIRGDNAFAFAQALEAALLLQPDEARVQNYGLVSAVLRGLLSELQACDVRRGKPVAELRPYAECRPGVVAPVQREALDKLKERLSKVEVDTNVLVLHREYFVQSERDRERSDEHTAAKLQVARDALVTYYAGLPMTIRELLQLPKDEP